MNRRKFLKVFGGGVVEQNYMPEEFIGEKFYDENDRDLK